MAKVKNPMDVVENKYLLNATLENQTDSVEFKTGGKYVDKNIKVKMSVQDAVLSVDEKDNSNAITVAESAYLTDTANDHAIVIDAKAVVGSRDVKVTQQGWIDASDNFSVEGESVDAEQVTKYIVEGTLGGDGAASATSDTIKITEGEGDFQFTASAAGEVKVTKAGWLDKDTKVETGGDKVYSVQAATVANAATEGAEYVEGHSGAVVSGGYLYINEGYIKDTKISLAEIVPDEANIGVTTSDDLIYKTVTAYDKDGQLVTGSMQDATLSAITAEDASATIASVSVAAGEGVFKVTGSKAIEGTTSVAIASTGYATTDLTKSGVISGEANVDAELDVIKLGVAPVEAATVKPELEVKSNVAKLVEDSDYTITVKADAVAKEVSVTPVVSAEGYGTAALNDATAGTVVAGSAAAEDLVLHIQAGSHAVSEIDANYVQEQIVVASAVTAEDITPVVLSAKEEGKNYLTISTSNTNTAGSVAPSVVCTSTEGYIEAGTTTGSLEAAAVQANVTQAADKFIEIYDGSWI